MRVITNNVPRDLVYWYELTDAERSELDHVDTEQAQEDWQGFRYKGSVYSLSDFSADWGITRGAGLPSELAGWDGHASDSYFSGVVIRWPFEENSYHGRQYDYERVIVGTFFA